MLLNNLKMAFRALWNRKSYSALHIFGLALGLTCCLCIYLFVQHELSFDDYHANFDRIHRVNTISTSKNGTELQGDTPFPTAEAMRLDFPDMEAISMIYPGEEMLMEVNKERFIEEDVYFVEPDFLDVFDYEAVAGDLKEVLAQPNQLLLSQSVAKKYFGEISPIGQTIKVENLAEMEVGGVFKDTPSNTHFPSNIFISFKSFSSEFLGGLPHDSWDATLGGMTFVTIPAGTQAADYNGRLTAFFNKYLDSEEATNEAILQPLSSLHFDTQWDSNLPVQPINKVFLWVFGIIGAFVLVIACVNFINLSTAQAMQRAKEVGVRKVLGAEKFQLIRQFLGEAYLIAFLALILAILIAEMALPFLNSTMDLSLSLDYWANGNLWFFTIGVLLLVGLFSGMYPAYIIAKFQPVKVLKTARTTATGGSIWMRRSLVVFQFATTFVLLIGTIVISEQLEFCKNKDLGFNKEAVLMVDMPERDYFDVLRNEWTQHPDVEAVSFSLGAPTSGNNIGVTMKPSKDPENSMTVATKAVDENYASVFGLELIAGRLLNEQDARKAKMEIPRAERVNVLVVNETLTKKLGYSNPDEILGEKLQVSISGIEGEVVGVVKDFNMASLHRAIEPMVMLNFPYLYYRAGLKVNKANLSQAIDHVENIWSKQFPNHLFDYSFLDDNLQALYENESRLFFLFRAFAGLAILIGCLGLWGLVSFTTQQRTKEIGVRKVLGATTTDIVFLLSNEFTKLVIVSFVIAAPLGWFMASKWLSNFSYAVQIGISVFIVSLLVALVLAWLTVGYRSLQAAMMNPVKTLKDD